MFHKSKVIDGNFVNLFSQSVNFGGTAVVMLNNITYNMFNYFMNVTSDVQTQIKHLKLIGGISISCEFLFHNGQQCEYDECLFVQPLFELLVGWFT